MAEPTTTPSTSKPTEPSSKDSATTKSKTGAVKKWSIVVGLALLATVVAFGVGYFLGRAGQDELQERAATATRQSHLLEGRRRLDLAHVALEQRNFGIAEAHVRAAAQKLDAATEDGPEPMQALARQVAETRIGVTGDIAGQQQELRRLIDGFDQHYERLQQTGTETSATPAD